MEEIEKQEHVAVTANRLRDAGFIVTIHGSQILVGLNNRKVDTFEVSVVVGEEIPSEHIRSVSSGVSIDMRSWQ